MIKELNNITTAFKAEWLKTKGLGLLYFALGIAALMPVISLIVHIFRKASREYPNAEMSNAEHFLYTSLSGFAGFFLLLFIIIAATRIAQTDHKNNGWVFLETQPLSKFSIYTAKFLTVFFLSLISITIFYVVTILIATLDLALFPIENLTYNIDFEAVLHSFIRTVVMILGIISFQMMLSVMIPGFVWPFVIGFVGFVINIVGKIRNETYDFLVYNNLDTSLQYANPQELNRFFTYTDYLSIFWAVLFFIIGYLAYSRRGIRNAFFRNWKKAGITAAGIAVAVALFFIMTKPVIADNSGQTTVIEGKIISNKPVEKVVITENDFGGVFAEIPVKDGKFRWESKSEIPFGLYTINFAGKNDAFFMSKGDHLDLIAGITDKKMDLSFRGSRSAEKYYLDNTTQDFSAFHDEIVKEKKFANDPEEFYTAAREEWEKQQENLKKFRTKENYTVHQDFHDYISQLNAVKILNAINSYRTMTSFSDKKFAPPADFTAELNNVLSKPAPPLLATTGYNTWKIRQLMPENSQPEDSLVLAKISQMPAGVEKDRLLRTQLKNTFQLLKEESRRNAVAQQYLPQFTDPKFRQDTEKQLYQIKSQQKGAVFPAVIFEDENGKLSDLSQFKGKYVVLDFWATWCAPCRETSPVFDYQAGSYQYYNNLVFVAASIDEDRQKWKLDIKNKKFNVKNLWVKNQNILNAVGVNEIPRFMVIDPEGKIYNGNMPRPGETNFTDILDEIADRKGALFNF